MKPFAPEFLGRLQAAADIAIWRPHNEVRFLPAHRVPSATVPEEDYVATFILYSLPILAESWIPLLKQWGTSLILTGVFCHQTPKARFQFRGKTVSPELADLLIVRRHFSADHTERQCAVLIQAKMSTDGEIKLRSNDPQLYLYSKWPAFELIGYKAPKTVFCLGQHCEQARYAGITKGDAPNIPKNIGWASFCPWSLMPPKESGWVEEPLSRYLTKMLNFDAGRDFYDPDITGCHWSELIQYLLKTTFAMPLRTRDMRFDPDQPRGRAVSMNRTGFMASSSGSRSEYVPVDREAELSGRGNVIPPEDLERQFDEGGIGRVITIETREEHEPRIEG